MIWGGRSETTAFERDLMEMSGCTAEEARAIADETEETDDLPDILVLPEFLSSAVKIASSAASQLRLVQIGMGGVVPMGFDYNAVAHIANWMGISINDGVFSDLGVIEAEGCKILQAPS